MSKDLPHFRVRRIGADRSLGAASRSSTTSDTANRSGRVQFDDRGNAVWSWEKPHEALIDTGTTQPLEILEHPGLSLADDAPTPLKPPIHANPLGVVTGYNPYESGKLDPAKKEPIRKKDLRKLGEWIKMRNQLAAKDPEVR